MKTVTLILASCISGLCAGTPVAPSNSLIQNISVEQAKKETPTSNMPLYAGHYLASRFAQHHHDWNSAYKFLSPIVNANKDEDELKRRAMMLSLGAGDYKEALVLAKEIQGANSLEEDILSRIFLIVDTFKNGDYEQARTMLKAMPENNTGKFVGPFIEAWSAAAQNKLEISTLQDKESPIKLYHGILISDYLNDYSVIQKTLENALKVEDIQPAEIVKIADIYGHTGMKDQAIALYEKAKGAFLKIELGALQAKVIDQKIEALKNGTNEAVFEEIKSPSQGLAKAFYDIANTLYQESNDEPSQIFARIALYIDSGLYDATLLLADISAKNAHYREALALYEKVPESHVDYIPARHKMADMLDEMKDTNKALNILELLAHKTGDITTRIKIGDIYRRNEQFGQALDSYNKAANQLGNEIPDEYWHIYYLRGMVHEQAKNWTSAEADLKKALSYRPDHPYVLNYLGYAWADRGENLDEALSMIKQAVNLRPNDGYIIDSLGWVEYRVGNYEAAVPYLEKAVELLPYDPIINDHLGDAYWQVGRKLEARFQWERSINHSDDEEAIKLTQKKLVGGLKETHKIAEAAPTKTER